MKETTISMERVYEGRIVSLELHEVEMRNGTRTGREVVRHGPAVAVVAELSEDRFVFVRQYRKPVEKAILELVAGGVEPEESAEDAACREVREETGYEVTRISQLGTVYPSPGYVDERIDIFHAKLWAEPAERSLDDDEDLEVHIHSKDVVRALIRTGQIQDAKTMAGWLLFEQKLNGKGEGS